MGARHCVSPRKAADERRGSSAKRGYGARWQRAARAHLRAHPLCVCCEANGWVEPAVLVDHAVPHKGDMGVFWRSEWWQGLCEWCDRHVKQPIEARHLKGDAEREALFLGRVVSEWRPPAER